MNRVHLQSNGQLYHGEVNIQSDPMRFLGYEVTLASECTLRSVFNCLDHYSVLAALNPFLNSFMQHYRQCPAQGCLCDDIDHLALSRTAEIIGYPPPARMELSVSLEGFRETQKIDIRIYWLENLLDVPFKLGRLNHVVFGDQLNTLQFDTVFNLFELIDGICWQLSFHNMPASCRINA